MTKQAFKWFPVSWLFVLAVACSDGGSSDGLVLEMSPPDPAKAQAELIDLIKRSKSVNAKAFYRVEEPSTEQYPPQNWVLTQRPPDFREDDFTNDPFHVASVVIVGGRYYLCRVLRDSAEGAPDGRCQVSPEGELREGPTPVGYQLIHSLSDLLLEKPTGFEVTGISTREMAGKEVSCFALGSLTFDEFQIGELCYSGEPILMFAKASKYRLVESGAVPEPVFIAEATQATREVADSDFEVPNVPVEDIRPLSTPSYENPDPSP